MNIDKNIMQGFIEAVYYQQHKAKTRKTKILIKPVDNFRIEDIKQMRQRTRLNQAIFINSLSVPFKAKV